MKLYARLISAAKANGNLPQGVLIGQYASGAEAWSAIQNLSPDVVFLELDIKKTNVSDLETLLKGCRYPVELWRDQPYDPQAWMSIRTDSGYHIVNMSANTAKKDPPPSAGLLYVYSVDDSSGKLIRHEDIVLAYSSNKRTYLRTQLRTYLYKGTLSQLGLRLGEPVFFRCNRSAIINMKMIRQLRLWSNMRVLVVMNDYTKTEITISRNYLKKFRGLVDM